MRRASLQHRYSITITCIMHVQNQLSKTEASCSRLMNEASEKDKEIVAATQTSQQDNWASQDEHASGDREELQFHKLKLKRASPKKT
jgi:hypothetical protein